MSQKKLDSKGRWRNKTVSFRISPEEWDELEILVRISGMNKQDYYRDRILQKDVIIKGNPRVHKALKTDMFLLMEELKRICDLSECNELLIEKINTTIKIYSGLE